MTVTACAVVYSVTEVREDFVKTCLFTRLIYSHFMDPVFSKLGNIHSPLFLKHLIYSIGDLIS